MFVELDDNAAAASSSAKLCGEHLVYRQGDEGAVGNSHLAARLWALSPFGQHRSFGQCTKEALPSSLSDWVLQPSSEAQHSRKAAGAALVGAGIGFAALGPLAGTALASAAGIAALTASKRSCACGAATDAVATVSTQEQDSLQPLYRAPVPQNVSTQGAGCIQANQTRKEPPTPHATSGSEMLPGGCAEFNSSPRCSGERDMVRVIEEQGVAVEAQPSSVQLEAAAEAPPPSVQQEVLGVVEVAAPLHLDSVPVVLDQDASAAVHLMLRFSGGYVGPDAVDVAISFERW